MTENRHPLTWPEVAFTAVIITGLVALIIGLGWVITR